MADRPILFSGPMVRAILDGRKTQTRRVLNPQPFDDGYFEGVIDCTPVPALGVSRPKAFRFGATAVGGDAIRTELYVPRYVEEDRLWVREAWWHPEPYSYGTLPSGDEIRTPRMVSRSAPVVYAADGAPPNCHNRHYGPSGLRPGSGAFAAPDPWAVWTKRPSIHMPRWVSRLTLTVTDVRVQRLWEISSADARAEGAEALTDNPFGPEREAIPSYRWGFAALWASINGASSWSANPWVAALTFTVAKANIDALPNREAA